MTPWRHIRIPSLAAKLSVWLASDDADPIIPREIHAGATFARVTKTKVTETARVIHIADDAGGIPHVCYDSRLHRADRTLDRDQRTLALPSFLKRFDRPSQRRASGRAELDMSLLGRP